MPMNETISPTTQKITQKKGETLFENTGGLTKFEHVKISILSSLAAAKPNADKQGLVREAEEFAHLFFNE